MREQQNKQRKILAIAAMMACISIFLIQRYVEKQCADAAIQAEALLSERQALALANHEIMSRDQQEDALAQFQLRAERYQRATNDMISMLASGSQKTVCLSGVARVKSEISLSGYAWSVGELMAELNRWRATDMFSNVTLLQVKGENGRVTFQARVTERKEW